MAKKIKNNPADVAKAAGSQNELKRRFAFLAGALIVFRSGTFIPVPGVDPAALASFLISKRAICWRYLICFQAEHYLDLVYLLLELCPISRHQLLCRCRV